jgi:hypothetical protein
LEAYQLNHNCKGHSFIKKEIQSVNCLQRKRKERNCIFGRDLEYLENSRDIKPDLNDITKNEFNSKKSSFCSVEYLLE